MFGTGTKKPLISCFLLFWIALFSFGSLADNVIEEVIVVAEKRNESLQDLSQAVTVLSGDELDNKNMQKTRFCY